MTEVRQITPEEEDRLIEEAFADVLNGYLRSNHRKIGRASCRERV